MLRQTHCHVSFTRLWISSSNNKLYRLLYIRERERMSGLVIWYEHECPGWSFDVSTNVRGGHSMWARMSGVVIWCEHECPALSKNASERMSVGTNVHTPSGNRWLIDWQDTGNKLTTNWQHNDNVLSIEWTFVRVIPGTGKLAWRT